MSVQIEARGLEKAYRDGPSRVDVLRGVDLSVAAGEIVAVTGPSGSGKSTLLHLLGGLDRPDAGSVSVGGRAVAKLNDASRAIYRLETVGFVFQFHQLLPDFTALENVMLPGRIAGRSPEQVEREASSLLAEVGLEERIEHFPNQLSGGECQRVALCRALVMEPPLLLADEPTGNLDPKSAEMVLELILKLVRRRGTTALVVTHNPLIAQRCARIFELENGFLAPR